MQEGGKKKRVNEALSEQKPGQESRGAAAQPELEQHSWTHGSWEEQIQAQSAIPPGMWLESLECPKPGWTGHGAAGAVEGVPANGRSGVTWVLKSLQSKQFWESLITNC